MLGAIVGAGLSALGSIYGGIKSAQAARKVRKSIRKQMDENQDWYDRNYNEDYTQRADAQRILTMTQDAIRKRNRAAAGTQAVMGGTEESVAAAKAANNQALSDTASRIAAAGEARKDQVENQYLNRKEALQNQLNQSHAQQAQNIAAATQGVANAAGSIGLALDANQKVDVTPKNPVIKNAVGGGFQPTDYTTTEWLDDYLKNNRSIWLNK